MPKPHTFYLFTNRNCMVFDENGEQMPELQACVSCYNVDADHAREVLAQCREFFVAHWGSQRIEVKRRHIEYLLGLRTLEMDVQEHKNREVMKHD